MSSLGAQPRLCGERCNLPARPALAFPSGCEDRLDGECVFRVLLLTNAPDFVHNVIPSHGLFSQ